MMMIMINETTNFNYVFAGIHRWQLHKYLIQMILEMNILHNRVNILHNSVNILHNGSYFHVQAESMLGLT